jgi:hypothetical protein
VPRLRGDPDAHVFEGSVTLTRTTDDARRRGACIQNLIDQARSPAQVDRMVIAAVKAEMIEPSGSGVSAPAGVPQ